MTVENGAMVYRPPLGMRIWRAMGFGWPHLPDPWEDEPVDGMAEGYLTTETFVHLDWKDRLRLLVSGRLMLVMKTKTDVPVYRAISVSKTGVLSPLDRP